MGDTEIRRLFEESYREASAHWSPWLSEACEDLKASAGDQWSTQDAAYLKAQRRNVLVFNKIRRVVKLVEGYQRKNRLAFQVDPVEGGDQETADQFTALLLWVMQYADGYNVMSDAFAGGALKTGLNLVNLYLDYTEDPVSGDLRFCRLPYNRFLIDPQFTRIDLSDCGYVIRREYLREASALALLPGEARRAAESIIRAKRSGKAVDGKFSEAGNAFPDSLDTGGLYRYDEFFYRESEQYTSLLDVSSGAFQEWAGDKQKLRYLLGAMPNLKTVERTRPVIKHAIFLEGVVVWRGDELTGCGGFPFVPVVGFYEPEISDARYRLQGIVRCMRDPQAEVNRRRSKMLDIIDSQITTGWQAKEGSVANPKSLYQAGQGQVIWMKTSNQLTDAQRLPPPDIPAGLMQLNELFDKDIVEIPGANAELMGSVESGDIQIAGILAKMRQGQGLTILQDLFDNYRLSKKVLGGKIIRAIQNNWYPDKVAKVTGGQPTRQFFSRDFGKYDAIPVEGVLSDSQRQMYASQLLSLKAQGAPIPWGQILEHVAIQNKSLLLEAIAKEEQAQAAAAQGQGQYQQLQAALIAAKIGELRAQADRDSTQAIENRSSAVLDRIKAAAEIDEMDTGKVLSILKFISSQSAAMGQGEATGQPPNGGGAAPVAFAGIGGGVA